MVKTKIKPRWKSWESLCIEKSVEEKIQLKIIALALGKTLNAVSKKITHLGLREFSPRPGRVKGRAVSLKVRPTACSEINRMKAIVSLYAPVTALKKAENALETGAWVSATPQIQKGGITNSVTLRSKGLAYSYDQPMAYFLNKEKIQSFKYVTSDHIKTWATEEGFRPLVGNLIQQGLSYWKEGKYFSKAQVLIYLNVRRLEKSLTPVALCEDEGDLCTKSS